MAKTEWKAGNMLYPLPVVLVSCGTAEGKYNMMTAAWTGTICSDPPMAYISIRPERYSHDIIKDTGEFVINLTTKKLVKITDEAGVKSGRDLDKFREFGLTPHIGTLKYAPMIKESPVSIECRVKEMVPLGSHDMFIAEVVSVFADDAYLDSKGAFDLRETEPICYCHGSYFELGKRLGKFGFSVKKK